MIQPADLIYRQKKATWFKDIVPVVEIKTPDFLKLRERMTVASDQINEHEVTVSLNNGQDEE